MIKKSIKEELKKLQSLVKNETKAYWPISYGDIISFLLEEYKNNRIEIDLEKPGLYVSIPLQKVSATVVNLEGKNIISYPISD